MSAVQEMRCRPAQIDDFENLSFLWRSQTSFVRPLSTREIYEKAIDYQTPEILIALRGEDVVGVITFRTFCPVPYIDNVVAYPRGEGIGTYLLHQVEVILAACGYSEVAVFPPENHSELAQYYERLGYRETDNGLVKQLV